MDSVQVQGEGAESGIVRVWKGIDYGMEGVAPDDVVFVLWRPVSKLEERMGKGNVLEASINPL